MAWAGWFLTLSVTCGAVAVQLFLTAKSITGSMLAVPVLLTGGLFFHIWSLKPSRNMSISGISQLYLERILFSMVGYIALYRFKSSCADVENVQKTLLMKLLKRGRRTVFGKDHKLEEITTVEDFRLRMPLTTYDDYRPYVERSLKGEKHALIEEEVDFFAATSGTTSGKSKLFPTNSRSTLHWYMTQFVVSFASEIPNGRELKFHQHVWTRSSLLKTDLGIPKGSISSGMLKYQAYNVTPKEGYLIADERSSLYVHMLFGIREPEVFIFMTLTSSTLLMLFSLVEERWKDFVRDIRRGEIDSDLIIPSDLKTGLNQRLQADPKRADELESIFTSGFSGVIPRIWPHLAGISTICTGPFALQAQVVKDRYLGHDIPMYSFVHMSTEGPLGVLLYDKGIKDPLTQQVRDDYVIMSANNFYEFIPAENTEQIQPDTVLAHQVKKDQDYEMVVTLHRGLYRYRTGDLVRVAGFRGNTPTYRVLQRVGNQLNVYTEKVPEVVFCEAVQSAAKGWRTGKLTYFAGTENIHVDEITGNTSDKLFYVIYVSTDTDEHLTEAETNKVDMELCRLSDTYRAFRMKGTISPAHVTQVANESFQLIRNMASENNPLLYKLQYKHPKIVHNPDWISLLISKKL